MAHASPSWPDVRLFREKAKESVAGSESVADGRSAVCRIAEEMVTALIEYRGLSAGEAQRIREMINKSEKKKR